MYSKNKITAVLLIGILCTGSQIFPADSEPNQISKAEQKSTIDSLKDKLHLALGRGKGFKTPFSRGAGYWSAPEDEGKTGYFERLAEQETQREDWYVVTPYISEFWCSVSNLGLIYVGLKHKSPAAAFAGLASFAYHSCPKQWLLHVDRVGVLAAFLSFAKEYKVVKENPRFLAFPVAVLAINGLDVVLGQYKGKTWPHAIWHLSAALMADRFLSCVANK